LLLNPAVVSVVQVILSPQNYPLHVMCKFGHHRTGTVIGCLRKLQGWNLTAIFEEYRRYAGSKVRFLNEQVQLSLMNSTSLFLLRGNAVSLLSILGYQQCIRELQALADYNLLFSVWKQLLSVLT
jgi:hypothetical protein